MKSTLYISDLNGTLFTNKALLKDRCAEMLKHLTDGGVLFSYATAHHFNAAYSKMRKADIKLPVILMNGVIIADSKIGAPICVKDFKSISLASAFNIIKEYKETPLVYSYIDGIQRISFLKDDILRIKITLNDMIGDTALRPCQSYDELFMGDIHFFRFINPIIPKNLLSCVFSYKNGFSYDGYFDNYHKGEYRLDVFSADADKGKAALKIKEMIKAEELVCFGDRLNDLSMFKAADRSYAVFNAVSELKEYADGIIGSHENMGVVRFVENEALQVFQYTPQSFDVNMSDSQDSKRFIKALEEAKNREKSTIGTLNEKCIHAALKNYFSDSFDREAKIGAFYADAVTENGIFEIQSGNFSKLNKKLEVMLSVCHVTVVYPLERRTRVISIDDVSGEVIREGNFRYNNSLTDFFLELYRIKSFLTNPNLTICIAELDVERVNYVYKKTGKRRRRGAYVKTPTALRRKIYLENAADYLKLLNERFDLDELNEEFTVKELQEKMRATDAKIALEILLYLGAADKVGKRGNAEIYKIC